MADVITKDSGEGPVQRSRLVAAGVIACLLILVYLSTYISFREARKEKWSADGRVYVIYPADNLLLYRIHRPLMYLDGLLSGMRFHIGPHRANRGQAALVSAEILRNLRTGDIIFQTSRSTQSEAIQLATHSPYSHMGLIEIADSRAFVIEAIQTVSRTPLGDWIARGDEGKFSVKRLADPSVLAAAGASTRLIAAALHYKGRRYDPYFGWSDDLVYCSEIVWKAYDQALGIQLGKLRKLRDFDISHPKVAAKLRERYETRIPLDEDVIAPSDIYECGLLATVLESGT